MEVGQLQRRYIEYNASLFNEGYFNRYFAELQQIQASGQPGFVAKLFSTYFADSDKILNELTVAMNQQTIDFKKVDAYAFQFKGSTASLGAQRLLDVFTVFHSFCSIKHNTEACKRRLLQVTQEYVIMKGQLHNLFWLERQIVEAGGVVPLLQH